MKRNYESYKAELSNVEERLNNVDQDTLVRLSISINITGEPIVDINAHELTPKEGRVIFSILKEKLLNYLSNEFVCEDMNYYSSYQFSDSKEIAIYINARQ